MTDEFADTELTLRAAGRLIATRMLVTRHILAAVMRGLCVSAHFVPMSFVFNVVIAGKTSCNGAE
jgi:hypothetical protein